jgi:NADH:ubiquinone oxidoreductase subunit 5 (subunit L)/multisubunit Na+/H+ antiporter MnhA subunit
MVLYIVVSPLIPFFIGFFVKDNLKYYMNFTSTSFSASLFLFVFVFMGGQGDGFIDYHSVSVGPLQISWSFHFNVWVCIKLVMVTYITAALQVDFMDSMKHDQRLPRYMSYLALCSFFLLILLTGNHFTEISIGWKS